MNFTKDDIKMMVAECVNKIMLSETSRGPLFHYASIYSLTEIIKDDEFLMGRENSRREENYISFTRQKNPLVGYSYDNFTNYTDRGFVRFEFQAEDLLKIRNAHIDPYDYFTDQLHTSFITKLSDAQRKNIREQLLNLNINIKDKDSLGKYFDDNWTLTHTFYIIANTAADPNRYISDNVLKKIASCISIIKSSEAYKQEQHMKSKHPNLKENRRWKPGDIHRKNDESEESFTLPTNIRDKSLNRKAIKNISSYITRIDVCLDDMQLYLDTIKKSIMTSDKKDIWLNLIHIYPTLKDFIAGKNELPLDDLSTTNPNAQINAPEAPNNSELRYYR